MNPALCYDRGQVMITVRPLPLSPIDVQSSKYGIELIIYCYFYNSYDTVQKKNYVPVPAITVMHK